MFSNKYFSKSFFDGDYFPPIEQVVLIPDGLVKVNDDYYLYKNGVIITSYIRKTKQERRLSRDRNKYKVTMIG